jgi:hypothetical protein
LRHVEHLGAHRLIDLLIGIEMHADVEVSFLRVVEVHDRIQVFILAAAAVVVERHHVGAPALQLLRNAVDDPARLVDLVEDAAGTADVETVTGRQGNAHFCLPLSA